MTTGGLATTGGKERKEGMSRTQIVGPRLDRVCGELSVTSRPYLADGVPVRKTSHAAPVRRPPLLVRRLPSRKVRAYAFAIVAAGHLL